MNSTLKSNLLDHKQGSDEWFEARAGRMTASKAEELESNGSRKMTAEELKEYKIREPKGRRTTIDCIGETALNLAIIAATEEIIGVDKNDYLAHLPDIKRGKELEPVAFKAYKEKMELEFLEVFEVGFCNHGEHAGCSLDGYVSDNSSLEIKCPRREKFFKIVAVGVEQLDNKWIAQAHFQMMCAGTDQCRFVIFYVENGESYLHDFIIKRDEERIKSMQARLDELIELKKMYKKDLLTKLNR